MTHPTQPKSAVRWDRAAQNGLRVGVSDRKIAEVGVAPGDMMAVGTLRVGATKLDLVLTDGETRGFRKTGRVVFALNGVSYDGTLEQVAAALKKEQQRLRKVAEEHDRVARALMYLKSN